MIKERLSTTLSNVSLSPLLTIISSRFIREEVYINRFNRMKRLLGREKISDLIEFTFKNSLIFVIFSSQSKLRLSLST